MIFVEMPSVVKGLATKLCRIINGLEEECLPRTRGFTDVGNSGLTCCCVSPPHAGVHRRRGRGEEQEQGVSPARGGSPRKASPNSVRKKCLPRTRGFTFARLHVCG